MTKYEYYYIFWSGYHAAHMVHYLENDHVIATWFVPGTWVDD